MERDITCLCEHTFGAEFPDLVDLGREPAAEDQILEGSFMSVRCPKCGKLLKPEFPFRLVDESRGIDVYLVPSLDRNRFLAGRYDALPTGVRRVVVGFGELQEKLRVANARLDDRVVEIAKFHLLRRAAQQNPGREITIYFGSRGGGELSFDVYGLREGEVGRVRVAEEKVERIAQELPKNLKREPYRSFLAGPYVSSTLVEEVGEGEVGEDTER